MRAGQRTAALQAGPLRDHKDSFAGMEVRVGWGGNEQQMVEKREGIKTCWKSQPAVPQIILSFIYFHCSEWTDRIKIFLLAWTPMEIKFMQFLSLSVSSSCCFLDWFLACFGASWQNLIALRKLMFLRVAWKSASRERRDPNQGLHQGKGCKLSLLPLSCLAIWPYLQPDTKCLASCPASS